MKKGKLLKLKSGLLILFVLVFAAYCAKNTPTASQETAQISKAVLTQVSSFGSNPGNIAMYKYVPAGLTENAPLVVAIHGCAQDAATYANDTEWNKLADEFKFSVVYPQTNSSNNATKCWNFFETGDQNRNGGEALSIKQMVDKMIADHKTDPARVYVTGLSSGGAFVNVMAAAYPDVFAGAAPMAGIPYKCASDMTTGFNCMGGSVTKTASQWGSLIKGAYSGYTGKYPKVSIWQGATDNTVKPLNATETMKGWSNVLGLSETPTETQTIQGSTRKIWKDAAGNILLEIWTIAGMAHGITVDPTGKDGKAGGATNSYSLDKGIWSSYRTAIFWGLDNTDKIPPVIDSFNSDLSDNGGIINMSAAAHDNVGISKVEFYAGGILKKTTSSAPYQFTWNTAQENNGTYVVYTKAYDSAGNVATSSQISVTISHGIADITAPIITADKDSGTYISSVTVTLSSNESAVIYYTLDGSEPTEDSLVYSQALTFTANTTLKFFGRDPSGNQSAITTKSYSIDTLPYSELVSDTLTNHYLAKRITATEYIDLGNGTNTSGINPDKIKYGYMNKVTLYKLKSSGKWVTDQSF